MSKTASPGKLKTIDVSNGVGLHSNSGGVCVEQLPVDPVREMPRELAAKEVVAYLDANGRTDSFDLAIALDLDPEFVETLCGELAVNGQIAER